MQQGYAHTVTQATFDMRVIQRSAEVPVVVDFWAPWCQPCLMLGPILERQAAAAQGAWDLVKIDIDREPLLARRYQVQSIPAVKAFRDGKVAAEFLGAQPEPAVRAFLARLMPSAADRAVTEATALASTGDLAGAQALLREALRERSDHPQALLNLAELLLRLNATDAEARTLLDAIPAATPEGKKAAALRGRLRFGREAETLSPEEAARQALAAREDDLDAHWALGVHAAAKGNYREALEHFLAITQRDRRYREDGGRKAMLSVFDILGSDDPLSLEYRARLSSALY